MTNDENSTKGEKADESGRVKPLHVISSVFAAGLGVQSSKNRERDFKQGSFKVFVITGIVFTLVFIGSVFAIVKMVLNSAGA